MAESTQAGLIGRPLDRVDGALKVTGRATYAFEYATQGSAAYGVIVSASIGKGRILAVDARDAHRSPGVLLVMTKDNAPSQTPWGPVDLPDRFARAEPALNTDEVLYFGFPVAFVVAETFEQASAAAAMVRVQYDSLPGDYDLRAAGPSAENPGRIDGNDPADSAVGDFESAFADAPVKIDANYTTPHQHQAPMEPHATMAAWEGGMLTVHTSAQLTTSPKEGLARTFNIPKENVRIITRYVGGGFGSKLPYYVDATLAAIGARALGRPVKVAMTRPQLFHITTHRTASEQHLRLGADRDGRLIAYGQDALVHCARFDMFTEPVCGAARMLYAAPDRLTRHRRAKLDLPRSDSMRAPGDAIGFWRSNARWTSWHTRCLSIRSSCAFATTPRPIRSGTCPSPLAILRARCARARPASAGTSASQSRPASATGAGSSASASPRRSVRTYSRARRRVRAWSAMDA
jgi:xanthine dehydrogenase YagR molybdenum-binding subunit